MMKVRKIVNLQDFKIYVLCKMIAMVILHQFLSSGHTMSNMEKQESNLLCVHDNKFL